MPSADPIRRLAVAALLSAALLPLGCGSGDDSADNAGPPLTQPAANDGSADVPPPEPGDELSESDRDAVSAATRDYIAALDADDGAAVCALLEPGVTEGVKLPAAGSDCAASVDASIGHGHSGGTPQWKHTKLLELTAVSVGADSARVTATVVHTFADRNYPSVEEDVIYLDREGERWLIAKPSGSFYRAVGYPEPPLRAFTAP